jgi:hypothetical protein
MRGRYLVLMIVGLGALGVAWVLTRADGFSTRARPSAPERLVSRVVRRLAVPRRARDAQNPVPFTPEVWRDARAHFADHCAGCHGNDGRGETDLGRNLYPKAPDMRQSDTQRLSDGEIFWIIENGVRLTGMPAWGNGTADDEDSWKLVHFVRHLNELTKEHLEEMSALNPRTPSELDEEREDRAFLAGADSAAPSTPTSHDHPHKDHP